MNPLQPIYGGGDWDAFVAKINPTGSALVYSTYLGGSSFDASQGIAVDNAGNAYVVGFTQSTDFPTMNPLQPTNACGVGGLPCSDAFVTEINPFRIGFGLLHLSGHRRHLRRGLRHRRGQLGQRVRHR